MMGEVGTNFAWNPPRAMLTSCQFDRSLKWVEEPSVNMVNSSTAPTNTEASDGTHSIAMKENFELRVIA